MCLCVHSRTMTNHHSSGVFWYAVPITMCIYIYVCVCVCMCTSLRFRDAIVIASFRVPPCGGPTPTTKAHATSTSRLVLVAACGSRISVEGWGFMVVMENLIKCGVRAHGGDGNGTLTSKTCQASCWDTPLVPFCLPVAFVTR